MSTLDDNDDDDDKNKIMCIFFDSLCLTEFELMLNVNGWVISLDKSLYNGPNLFITKS